MHQPAYNRQHHHVCFNKIYNRKSDQCQERLPSLEGRTIRTFERLKCPYMRYMRMIPQINPFEENHKKYCRFNASNLFLVMFSNIRT